MENTVFWIGTAAMASGVVGFLAMSLRGRNEDAPHYVNALFVSLAASGSYLAMALGQGVLRVEDGRPFYFARYIDWSVTTPLLLFGLGLLIWERIPRFSALIAGAVGADIFMIVTGLFAGLSSGSTKYIWYTVSMGAFLAILALIWGPLRAFADRQDAPRKALYLRLAGVLTALWLAYPIVWMAGSEGLRLASPSTENWIYMGLDVAAKVGFGFLLLNGVSELNPTGQRRGAVSA